VKVSFSSLFIVAAKTTHSFTISHDQFPLLKELFPPPKSQTSTILPDILHFGFASLFLCSLLIQFSFGLQLRIVLSWQISSYLCFLCWVICASRTQMESSFSYLGTTSPRCPETEIKWMLYVILILLNILLIKRSCRRDYPMTSLLQNVLINKHPSFPYN